jgi:uncharacterized protein involved in exopolysaccharide biosynthesis
MQDNFTQNAGDEISLTEFFMRIWSHKLIVAVSCIISIFLGINYILKSDKKFTSTSTFSISQKDTDNLSMLGNFASVSSFGGMKKSLNSDLLNGEIFGLEFIKNLDQFIDFRGDIYFNSYNPNYKDPAWKSLIKELIGWNNEPIKIDDATWQSIKNTYRESISLDTESDSIINISVTHIDPNRSAEIANLIVQKIINDKQNRDKDQQNKQLEYLSQTLASALGDLERSIINIKKFTVENSSTPFEKFAIKTEELARLREQLSRASNIHDALAKLLFLIKTGSIENTDYLLLREEFPIVDQVEFRRVLGQNEIITSWVWPEESSVNALFKTLSERRKRLEVEVSLTETEATKAAKVVEDFAALEREETKAEATYTVLLEQVKSQSMAAGYMPDSSRIFEFATPPLLSSFPNKRNIMAISIIIGLFVGCILALLVSSFRGVFYTLSAIISCAQAPLNISSGTLRPLRGVPLAKIESHLNKKSYAPLRSLAIEIHKNNFKTVLFSSLKSKINSHELAKAMAVYMQADNLKIAIINFTTKQQIPAANSEINYIGAFNIVENVNKISVLQPKNKLKAIELLGRRNFQDQLLSINSHFDLIFLTADDNDAISLAGALINIDITHIAATKIKRTKPDILVKLQKLIPVQGLLHE